VDPTGFDEEVLVIASGAYPRPNTAGPPKPPAPPPPPGAQPGTKDPDVSQALAAGAARLPKDVGTTGGGRTAPPQPAATIAEAGKGVVAGVYWTYTPNVVGYLKALTGVTLADNTVKGARDDGALGAVAGAVNTINPLFHWGIGVVDAQEKANAGDTAGAAAAGTGVVLGVATTVLGGALGAGAETPRAYSVAFQTELDAAQFGLSRARHFAIANDALARARAASPELADLVPAPAGRASPPPGWVWQHATAEQGRGQPGVLQLVPKPQHTGGSPFWRLLHPLPNGGGGYTEWAIPAGAPPN
jgi:hypothetical protein